MAKKKNVWWAVDILADAKATEAIEFAFNELDSLGTEIDSLRKSKTEPQIVTGFFTELPSDAKLETTVDRSLSIFGFDRKAVKNIATRIVEDTDWLAEWKKHWRPTEVGRFIISPPWENVDHSEKIAILIEPNMAFGTGTHETTQLCLKAVGDLFRHGQTFLDVGTGTGILAIAAAKLGGKRIFACDTDIDSIKIAKENAVANDVAWIDFVDGPLPDAAPIYDFVCANLTIDVIVPILPFLLSKSNSTLVLSGILCEQETIIADELNKNQAADYTVAHAGEWISVVVRCD